MGKPFMDADFLLESDTARTLFHSFAEPLPIIDYHCHIDPRAIAQDLHYQNIAQPWLEADHYKWRLMRANGAPEREVTGDASDWDRFRRWAAALDRAPGNPLYHWAHLELQRYFGYYGRLGKQTAQQVWTLCNTRLAASDMGARGLIRRSNVRLVCTTDDPADDLRWHRLLAQDPDCPAQVLPTWRPDRTLAVGAPDYPAYLTALADSAGFAVDSFPSLCAALRARMDFFSALGCRAADHGLDRAFFDPAPPDECTRTLRRALAGNTPAPAEALRFQSALLCFLGREYAQRGWVMQLHFGAVRGANSRMSRLLGADTGYDCIGDALDARALAAMLDDLESEGLLPKTILYSLNPNDNQMLGAMIGCFQGEGLRGKVQHGAAWWFNDTKAGIEAQLVSLASLSLLGNFVGMLTDSRSLLSYTRHEYFRRIFCNLLGGWVERGELWDDEQLLAQLVRDICFENANRFFGFGLSDGQIGLSHV